MIRQFDVFANPMKAGREDRPYVVSIQHRSLDHLPTRIVAPLVRKNALSMAGRLMPVVHLADVQLHVSPFELASLSTRFLKSAVGNLEAYRTEIIAALDLVFTGI